MFVMFIFRNFPFIEWVFCFILLVVCFTIEEWDSFACIRSFLSFISWYFSSLWKRECSETVEAAELRLGFVDFSCSTALVWNWKVTLSISYYSFSLDSRCHYFPLVFYSPTEHFYASSHTYSSNSPILEVNAS